MNQICNGRAGYLSSSYTVLGSGITSVSTKAFIMCGVVRKVAAPLSRYKSYHIMASSRILHHEMRGTVTLNRIPRPNLK